MWRRIYFSFPNAEQARRVVTDLELADVERESIHTIARSDIDITGLPSANKAQRNDKVWFWDKMFWNSNLFFFTTMLVLTILLLSWGYPKWAFIAGPAMAASFIIAYLFASKIPHAHLNQMRVPIAIGEVVLLVDLPFKRVREITQLVSRRHPEASLDGIGWTISSAGI